MKNLILCEGFDDAYILGYYIFKTSEWIRNNKLQFSETYKFPRIDTRRESIEYYSKDSDKLAIWSVGGKDSYHKAFKFIERTNSNNPEEGINRVFIVLDRDDLSIEEHLSKIKTDLDSNGIQLQELKNNSATAFHYIIEDKSYQLDVIPIIIPFDTEGAIETILMKSISEMSEENLFVVQSAVSYVDHIVKNKLRSQYLTKERLILKAKFSSVISITNPDRSTATYDKLLMSHEWESSKSMQRYLHALNTYLG